MSRGERRIIEHRARSRAGAKRAVGLVAPVEEQKLPKARALDALQTSSGKGVATPADWQPGGDVIIPVAVNDEAAKEKFGEFRKVLPYLRYTKVPG